MYNKEKIQSKYIYQIHYNKSLTWWQKFFQLVTGLISKEKSAPNKRWLIRPERWEQQFDYIHKNQYPKQSDNCWFSFAPN